MHACFTVLSKQGLPQAPFFPADEDEGEGGRAAPARPLGRACRIVLISGFESFNVDLYKKARPPLCCLAATR